MAMSDRRTAGAAAPQCVRLGPRSGDKWRVMKPALVIVGLGVEASQNMARRDMTHGSGSMVRGLVNHRMTRITRGRCTGSPDTAQHAGRGSDVCEGSHIH